MAASIKELDAIWNKYHAEYNKYPSSHHQLLAFAKAGLIINNCILRISVKQTNLFIQAADLCMFVIFLSIFL